MRYPYNGTPVSSKERARDQIRSQVEDFLRRGGKIRVLDKHHNGTDTPARASSWQGSEELLDLLA